MKRVSVVVLYILFALVMAMWSLVMLTVLAHASPVEYVPANYGPIDEPDGVCQADPEICYPRLTWWPGSWNHTFNLTGVRFWFWSPPYVNNWVPKAHVSLSVNYWGVDPGVLAPGDTMMVSGYQDVYRSFMTGVTEDSLTTVVGGKAWIDRVPADSVYEGRATIQLRNPAWTRDHVDTTYYRLVHEAYRQ